MPCSFSLFWRAAADVAILRVPGWHLTDIESPRSLPTSLAGTPSGALLEHVNHQVIARFDGLVRFVMYRWLYNKNNNMIATLLGEALDKSLVPCQVTVHVPCKPEALAKGLVLPIFAPTPAEGGLIEKHRPPLVVPVPVQVCTRRE